MATEDLVPTYLQEIFNRAIPNQLTDNEPLQAFTAPLDETSLKDVLSVVTSTHPSLYGAAKYGAGNYQARQDLTLSGGVITDAYRALGLDGDGLAAPAGVGIWSATTNRMRNGGAKTNLSFASAIGGATLTRDTTIAPMFGQTGSGCFKIVTGTSVNDGYFQQSATGLALPAGTVYTMSTWMRGAAGGEVVNVWGRVSNTDASLNDGTPTTCTLSTVWQRFSATVTVATGKTGDSVYVMARQPGTTSQTYFLDGVQAEAQSVATPYVYTDGAVRSRVAARVQAPATLLNETQGWIAMRIRLVFSMSQVTSSPTFIPTLFQWADSSNSQLRLTTSPGGGGSFQALRWNAGNIGGPIVASSHVAGDYVTLIMAWTATRVYLSVDGAALYTDGQGPAIPMLAATQFDVGSDQINGRWADSNALWVACGTGTLSNSDVSNLYSLGNTVPLLSQFSAVNYCTGIVTPVSGANPMLLLGP